MINTQIYNISKEIGSTARFLQTELDSVLTINSTTFTNMEISIANCFSSIMILDDVSGVNITSNEYIIDCYF